MNNEAKLPKTQAATLAEMRRIKATGGAPVQGGYQRDGINLAALAPLRKKGLIRHVTIDGTLYYEAV